MNSPLKVTRYRPPLAWGWYTFAVIVGLLIGLATVRYVERTQHRERVRKAIEKYTTRVEGLCMVDGRQMWTQWTVTDLDKVRRAK